MIGPAVLVVGLAGAALAALLAAAALRLRSLVSFLLAAALFLGGGLIGLAFALSAVSAFDRPGLLVGIALGLVGAGAVWHRSGRPATPPLRPALAAARDALREPLVAVLATTLALVYGYLAVVAFALPQPDWDALLYHLPRAALWLQGDAVGTIANAPDERLVAMPPGGEILVATTMGLARSDRWVALPQFAAVPIAMLGIVGLALRAGLGRRAALYGALLFASFPVIALQAPTALNDLVVVPPLLAAVYFALGPTRTEHALLALAVAVALVTKMTAILALPVLAVVVLVGAPARRWGSALAWGLLGCAAGSGWYVWNLVRTGSFDAGLGDTFEQVPDRSPVEVLERSLRHLTDFFELSGAVGRDRLWFPLVGAALLLVAARPWWRRERRLAATLTVAGALVAALPWLVDAVHHVLVHGFAKTLIVLGRSDLIGALPTEVSEETSPVFSWYGAAFAIAYAPCLLLCAVAVVRRARAAVVLALAAAPLAFVPVVALALTYDELRGRFFAFAVALAAASFGVLLRVRPLATAVTAAAVLTAGLSVVHDAARPLGVTLFEPLEWEAPWGDPRGEVFAAYARDAREDAMAFQELQRLPHDVTVALAVARDTFLYPAFAPRGGRRVVFVGPDGAVPDAAQWLVVGPGRSTPSCAATWPVTLERTSGWRILRHGERSCASEPPTVSREADSRQ